MVGDADFIFFGDDGNYCRFAEQSFLVSRLEHVDKFVGDAAEAAGKNNALILAGGNVLQAGDAEERGSVLGGGAPVGGTVAIPPLLDFGSVACGEFGERLGVE